MAEDEVDEAVGDDELVDGLEKKKFSGKKIVIIAGGVVGLLVIGFVAMSFLGGGEEKVEEVDETEAQIEELAQETAARNEEEQIEADKAPEELQLLFIPLEERAYNLNTDGEGASFLRMRVTLEVDRESYKLEIEQKVPRILDELNVYVRELRPSDLSGGAGILLLKEELLMRINQAVAPARVKDVLFQDLIIQGQ